MWHWIKNIKRVSAHNCTSRDLNFPTYLPFLNPKSRQKTKSWQKISSFHIQITFFWILPKKILQKILSKNPPKKFLPKNFFQKILSKNPPKKFLPKNFSQKIPQKKFRQKKSSKKILQENPLEKFPKFFEKINYKHRT